MCCERKLTNIFGFISAIGAPLFGVLIGVMFAMGLLPGIVIGVWVALGTAAVVLIGLIAGAIIVSANGNRGAATCMECRIGTLLGAIAGVLLAGVAALVIGLTVGSLLSAVIVGAGAFFFFLVIVQTVSLVLCLISNACSYR